jgi:hypothetical protein
MRSGACAAIEYVVTGTYTGQFPGLPPGGGQPFTIRAVSILELDRSTIRAEREYYDVYAFLVAIEALPAPAAAGTPTL